MSTAFGTAIRSWFGAATTGASAVVRGNVTRPIMPAAMDPDSPITQYRVLRSLYDSVGLYTDLATFLRDQGIWREAAMSLRNPANRVAEFYAAKIWPGPLETALPIVTPGDGTALKDAIAQVWRWSGWDQRKQWAARSVAIYGDLFLKVVGEAGLTPAQSRVYFQILEPETVTDYDKDARGFLSYLRLDVPIIRRDADGNQEAWTVTEVWERDAQPVGRFRKWVHQKGDNAALKDLGTPEMDAGMEQAFGVSFIPVVHVPFRDVGQLRGAGAYAHAFDKIREADRAATRLHQLIFRHSNHTLVLEAGGNDATGRPLPPPRIAGMAAVAEGERGVVELGDERMIALPGNAKLNSLVPNLPYAQLLAVLQDHMAELERDLPELAYYRLRELGGQLSGRAVRLLLSDAADRVIEARGNALAGLARADMMALTIGANLQIDGFKGIGSFDDGSLDHSFDPPPVFATDPIEDAQTEVAEVAAKTAKLDLGLPKVEALVELGYDRAKAEQFVADSQAEAQAGAEQFLQNFAAGRTPIDGQTVNGRSN